MRRTLVRYFFKHWAFPFAGALFFYGGLVLANEMVTISREIFRQSGSFRYLIPLLLSSLPETMGMVLPMAAVLGGLLGMQQLCEGSEMVASQGLGAGSRKILAPWSVLAAILFVGACFNAHVVVPKANAYQEALKVQMIDEARTRYLKPGAPPWFPASDPTLCVWMAPTGEIHLLENTAESTQHLVAQSFQWSKDDSQGTKAYLKLRLEDIKAVIYQKADDRVAQFSQKYQDIPIEIPRVSHLFQGTSVRYFTTPKLLESHEIEAKVELARRISLPVASAALLLLGIAMGFGHPRFQRGGAILKSLAIILVYYILLKYLENQFINAKVKTLLPLLLIPWGFLVAGWALLQKRMRPHRSNTALSKAFRRLMHPVRRRAKVLWRSLGRRFRQRRKRLLEQTHTREHARVLDRWTRGLWWKNWGATMGTFLTLSLLVVYANLAGDLSQNHISVFKFFHYWLFDLPPFLAVALPLAFLLGGVLTFSDATLSREWVALRAGGTSLVQWLGSGWRAWGAVLLLTLVIQALVAPAVFGKADQLYRQIQNKPQRITQTKPWMHLGATGIVWYLDGATRWGFPLKSPGEAPALLRWHLSDSRSEEVLWGELNMLPGLPAERLFPVKALRTTATAEEATTPDLFHWQKWAPDPERATMLWGRLLSWLAGPCLLFAMLAAAFPTPRGGRGKALGIALIVGLLYLGMQALFTGAAKAGELPAFWGVLSPMLILLGFGLMKLHHLKT